MMIYTKEAVSSFQEQTFAYLVVEEKNHCLQITLNRPAKRNAMSPTLVHELAYAMSYAHYTNDIWAVVLAANGKSFCAGADLKAFLGYEEANDSTIPKPTKKVVLGDIFAHVHKPVIAKVHASVYAGGFLLICGCTHVIAAKEANFALPEVKRGLWPMQVVASMLKIMPARTVLDFCMRARKVDAQEAHKLGLVTQVVEAEELDTVIDGLLSDIFANSPSAIRLGLKVFDEMRDIPEQELHTYLEKMLQETIKTQDAQEGLRAFKEKRKPVWTGN